MEKVTFTVGTEQLAGHLYKPDSISTPAPALLFTGPYTGVKEQVVGTYAQRLAALGFVTLAFDHRNFGESDGHIRQHEEPHKKIDDLGAATGFLSSLDYVNDAAIGMVGICLGGSYALRFAGFDPRIKALTTVAAAYVGFPPANDAEALGKSQWLASYGEELNLLSQGLPSKIPAVTESDGIDAGMPGQEPFDYYGTKRSYSEHWRNEITRLSSYNLASFDSIAATAFLHDTPSLVVHGTTDAFCSPENAQRAYDLMVGEKQIQWIDTTNHIELYDSEHHVAQSVELVDQWMKQHLIGQT